MKKIFLVLAFFTLLSCQKQNTNKSINQGTKNQVVNDSKKTDIVDMSLWYQLDGIFPQGEDYSKNRWLESVKKDVGINMNVLFAAKVSDYVTKINLTLSSGELADFLHLPADTFLMLMQSNQLGDITDAYEKYASPALKERISAVGDGKFMHGKLMMDNKLFGLGIPYRYEDVIMGYARKNWLEKLNMTPPSNFEELKELAKAFVNQDPDGNGQDDTTGIAVDGMGMTNYPLFTNFDAYPYIFTKEDGKLIWGGRSKNTKLALQEIKKLYDQGLLNKEFYNKSIWSKDPVIKDKAGIYFLPVWGPFVIANQSYQVDKARWVPFVIKKPNGQPAINKLPYDLTISNAISKNYKYPKKFIELENYLIKKYESDPSWVNYKVKKSDDTYVEGVHILVNYGLIEGLDPLIKAAEDIWDIEEGKKTESNLKSSKSIIGYDNYKKFKNEKDGNYIADYDIYNNIDGVAKIYKKEIMDTGNINYEDYNGPPPKSYVKYMGPIKAKMNELYLNMIIGSVSVEDGWKEWQEFFKNNNGMEVEKDINDWYIKNN